MSTDPAAEPSEIHYPSSAPRTVPENKAHYQAGAYLFQALELCLRPRGDVFVGADMFLYYEEGNPKARRAPDVMVAKGVTRADFLRPSYKVWEEGVVPQLVIEVTSKGTQREDLWEKRPLYESLGVAEYLLFDPLGEYLEPRFLAFHLDPEGRFQPAPLREDGSLLSPVLDLRFRPEGELLRVLTPGGEPVPRTDEAVRRAEEAVRRAEAEARRADEAEAELRRLRQRLGEADAD